MDHVTVGAWPRGAAIAAILLAGWGCTPLATEPSDSQGAMTGDRLALHLHAISSGPVTVSPNRLGFEYEGVELVCVFDPTHDRMRLFSPIAAVADLTGAHIGNILEANFHTALDARYATSDGVLYAAFVHPLGALSAGELESAVQQVTSLVRTFGTSYSSGALQFGPGSGEGAPDATGDPSEVPL